VHKAINSSGISVYNGVGSVKSHDSLLELEAWSRAPQAFIPGFPID
jgi:hypothetical protein